MKRTKITILHYAGPPVVGGVELTIYHQARLLAAAGYEVEVIAGRGQEFHSEVAFQLVSEIDSRHPSVHELTETLAQGQLTPAFARLRDRLYRVLKPKLGQAVATIVHNVVTLHKNLALTAALYELAHTGDAHIIAWCHDFAWEDSLYTPDLHPGYPWDLLRQPWPNTRYVVVSEHRRQLLSTLLGLEADTIDVVTPGVDAFQFLKLEAETKRLAEKLGMLEAQPLLLLPARVTRRKNIEFALRIMAALLPAFPHALLVITGPPGPHNPANTAYLQALKTLSVDLGITQNVCFLYEQGHGDEHLHVTGAMMSDFYQLADALLFPSLREGFGIPVLEAGLARAPVFAADIPSVRESGGDLVTRFDPDGDSQAVAATIAAYLQQDRSFQLRRRVLARYTWQAIVHTQLIPMISEVQDGIRPNRTPH